MSQPPDHSPARGARPRLSVPLGRLLGLGLFALGCLGVIWVVQAQPTIGVARQYAYPYRPSPPWGALATLALLALPLVGGAIVWAKKVPGAFSAKHPEGRDGKRYQEPFSPFSQRHPWAIVALFTLGGLLLRLGTAYAPKHFPALELAWPFLWKNTEGAYAGEARRAEHVGAYLAAYAHQLQESAERRVPHRVHLDTHPPGLVLVFVGLERFYDALPSVRRAVESWALRDSPSLAVLLRPGAFAIRHPIAVSLTAAHLFIVAASLAPLLCFAAARPILGRDAALAAAGLTALIPGTHLFNPSADQAFPTVTLLLCYVAVKAVMTRKWFWGVGFGLVLYGATFVHIGFGLVAVVVGVAAVLAWRAEAPERRVMELLAAYWRPAAAAVAAFLGVVLVAYALFDYSTFRVGWLCARNNGVFYESWGRTYWPWVVVMPFEFAVSLGFGLALVAGGGWLHEAAGVVRHRSFWGRSAVLLASGALVLAMDVLGLTLGEAARLWLFLTPLVAVGAVDYVWRRWPEPRRVLGYLFAVQLLHTLVLSLALDCGRTTTFLMDFLKEP